MTVYDDFVEAIRMIKAAPAYEPSFPLMVAPGTAYRWGPWEFQREGFGGLRYYSILERRAWMALPARDPRPIVELLT